MLRKLEVSSVSCLEVTLFGLFFKVQFSVFSVM